MEFKYSNEQIALLLALPEKEIDDLILEALLQSDPKPEYFSLIVSSTREARAFDLLEEDALIHVFENFRMPGFEDAKKLVNLRNYVLRLPGSIAANLLHKYAPDAGLGICLSVAYCKNSSRYHEMKDLFDSLDLTSAFVGGASQKLAEFVQNNMDEISTITNWVNDVIIEVTGITFPAAIAIKAFRFGMDELCLCCGDCRGSGRVKAKKCSFCKGDGYIYPY